MSHTLLIAGLVDKTHHMLSATIAAFASLSEDPARRNELRQHCERLIPRLDDPYLRVMFTRLTSDDWTEVLDEEGLPLRECVFLALHFLDDGALGAYLRRMADAGRAKGELDVLFLAGLGAAGLDAIQSWLDATGDVQTAAALAARIVPGKAQDVRVGRWIDTYRELLDGWQMFHERCDFDIARGEILGRAVAAGDIKSFEWAPKQLLLRCNYCSKVLDSPAQYDGRVSTRLSACDRANGDSFDSQRSVRSASGPCLGAPSACSLFESFPMAPKRLSYSTKQPPLVSYTKRSCSYRNADDSHRHVRRTPCYLSDVSTWRTCFAYHGLVLRRGREQTAQVLPCCGLRVLMCGRAVVRYCISSTYHIL
jgi:hypothetical protein